MVRSERASPSFDGFLVIDKPAGWTSHDVVARVRRVLGQRQVGHAGTLDPAATGVLPVAVGTATRVIEHLADASKTYLAEVTFGVRTDSFDGDGRVTAVADASIVTASMVEAALSGFRGVIQQVPPMWSAVKVDGRRLYEHARRGHEVDRAPRTVTISGLELLAWQAPTAELLVECSKGTYVRSLAFDLGEHLGVGAYLSNLVRLRTGPFSLCDAITLTELEGAALPFSWPELAYHPDVVLEAWPALILDETASRRWINGMAIEADRTTAGSCRAYDDHGAWLGVGEATVDGGRWRPVKVVASAA